MKENYPLKEEKELLIAAYKLGGGEIAYIDLSNRYPFIMIAKKHFPDDNDFEKSAKYIKAFKSLCDSEYIEYVSGSLYRLTASGIELAKELAEEE